MVLGTYKQINRTKGAVVPVRDLGWGRRIKGVFLLYLSDSSDNVVTYS